VMPFSLVEGYQHFRRACCFNLHASRWQQVPTEYWWISTKLQGSILYLTLCALWTPSATKSNLC